MKPGLTYGGGRLNIFNVIGFGELRRLSLEWQQDISDVELAYVTDWLLKGVFEHASLSGTLWLRGGSALRFAYFREYPVLEMPDLLIGALDRRELRPALRQAAQSAAAASGLTFVFLGLERGAAKFEYTGPLGHRSAAQPRISLFLQNAKPRATPTQTPLLHRFSDTCQVQVQAVALEEFIAEHALQLAHATPRARDLYDFWFALTRSAGRLDGKRMRELVDVISKEKGMDSSPVRLSLKPDARQALQRSWDRALGNIPNRPSLETVERDLAAAWNT